MNIYMRDKPHEVLEQRDAYVRRGVESQRHLSLNQTRNSTLYGNRYIRLSLPLRPHRLPPLYLNMRRPRDLKPNHPQLLWLFI
jgi:hypothetical protein